MSFPFMVTQKRLHLQTNKNGFWRQMTILVKPYLPTWCSGLLPSKKNRHVIDGARALLLNVKLNL